MAVSTPTPEELNNIRDLAAQWGKIISRRAFGDSGPPLDADFQTFEQVAQAAAQGLLQGSLSTFLEQQAQTLPDRLPCPGCGEPCPIKREPRSLDCLGGTFPYDEPIGHCSACRRAFFPSASPFTPKQPPLYS